MSETGSLSEGQLFSTMAVCCCSAFGARSSNAALPPCWKISAIQVPTPCQTFGGDLRLTESRRVFMALGTAEIGTTPSLLNGMPADRIAGRRHALARHLSWRLLVRFLKHANQETTYCRRSSRVRCP